MRLKTGLGSFLSSGSSRVMGLGFSRFRQCQLAVGHFEEVDNAKAIEQLGNPGIGIQQLNRRTKAGLRCSHFEAEPGQHSQESAVHKGAFGKIEQKIGVPPPAQFADQGSEINSGSKIRATGNLNASEELAGQY